MKNQVKLFIVFALIALFGCYSPYSFAQTKNKIVLLSGVERGSYHSIASDLKRLIESDFLKLERKLEGYEEDLDEIDADDSVEIKKMERKIERAETSLKKLNKIKISITPTKGSSDNFERLVTRTTADIAFLQYDVFIERQLADIVNNTYYTEDIRLLLPLGFEEIHILILKDSKIRKLSDLKGKRVATGTSKSGTAITSKIIKFKTKINWTDVPIAFETAYPNLMQKKIDALIFVGAAPVERFAKLPAVAREKIKLLSIEHPDLDVKNKGPYTQRIIPADKYKWLDEDVNTYAVRSILVTNIKGESDKIHKLNLSLFDFICDNIKDLQKRGHDVWDQVDFVYEGLDISIYEGVEEILELYFGEDEDEDEE